MGEITSTETARAYAAGALTGERVRLRPAAEEDYPLLDAWWQEPRGLILQTQVLQPRPAGHAAESFTTWSANGSYGNAGYAIEPLDDARLVGHIAVHSASLPVRAGVLGIIIGPDDQSKGYGSDAVRVMLRLAFTEMGLNRVELRVFAFNDKAIRTYERCGFVVEGRRRETGFHNGSFHDEIIMAVLARDWYARNGGGATPR